MVFTVNIPDRRGIAAEQRERLTRLGDDVVTLEGERGRYRPVEVGDALLVSVNADSETDAQQLVADVLGREPAELVATARDWVKPANASVTAARETASMHRRRRPRTQTAAATTAAPRRWAPSSAAGASHAGSLCARSRGSVSCRRRM